MAPCILRPGGPQEKGEEGEGGVRGPRTSPALPPRARRSLQTAQSNAEKNQKRSISQTNKLTFHSQKALQFSPRAKHVHVCDSLHIRGCQLPCTNYGTVAVSTFTELLNAPPSSLCSVLLRAAPLSTPIPSPRVFLHIWVPASLQGSWTWAAYRGWTPIGCPVEVPDASWEMSEPPCHPGMPPAVLDVPLFHQLSHPPRPPKVLRLSLAHQEQILDQRGAAG